MFEEFEIKDRTFCSICGDEIYGDLLYEFDGTILCHDCMEKVTELDGMSIYEIATVLPERFLAQFDDIEYAVKEFLSLPQRKRMDLLEIKSLTKRELALELIDYAAETEDISDILPALNF